MREPEPAPVPEPEQMRAPEAAPEAEPLPEPVPAAESPFMREPEPAPEPEPELHAGGEVHDEHHEEEAGRSFAARALTFLLILIAGAAIGIWGAPKLAPLLPAGLAPVAAGWPPACRRARRGSPTSRRGSTPGSAGSTRASRGWRPAATWRTASPRRSRRSTGGCRARSARCRRRSASSTAPTPASGWRGWNRTLDGQAAEVAALKEQLAGATARRERGRRRREIDVYRAELEGLRAEMGALSDQVQGLGGAHRRGGGRGRPPDRSRPEPGGDRRDRARHRRGSRPTWRWCAPRSSPGCPFEEPLERIASQPGVDGAGGPDRRRLERGADAGGAARQLPGRGAHRHPGEHPRRRRRRADRPRRARSSRRRSPAGR